MDILDDEEITDLLEHVNKIVYRYIYNCHTVLKFNPTSDSTYKINAHN